MLLRTVRIAPFEIGSLALKLVAHLIECCAGQYHDVELVEDDPGTQEDLP